MPDPSVPESSSPESHRSLRSLAGHSTTQPQEREGRDKSGESGPLCPEHDLRVAMTDAEFWDHVLNPPLPEHIDYGPSDIDIEDIEAMSHLANPCPECGQSGACAYDAEGRALIHVTEGSDG